MRALFAHAAALATVAFALWLGGGLDPNLLEFSPDLFLWMVAFASLLLLALPIARGRGWFERPLSRISWLLLPAGLAWLGSLVSLGAVPDAAQAENRCDLFLLAGVVSQRLCAAGLLATATLCLGALLSLETFSGASGGWRARWPLLCLAAPTAALSIWALLEPDLPRGVPIMDRAVLALWPIPALFAALWPVGRTLREHLAGRTAPLAAARALLALLAVLAGTLAFLFLNRARALAEGLLAASRISSLPDTAMAPEAAVLSSVAMRLLPWAGLLLLASFGLALWRERGERRPLALAAGVVLALSVVGVGFESQYQEGRTERCPAAKIAVENNAPFRRMARFLLRRSDDLVKVFSQGNAQRRKKA
ncbi:MAG: hypothetical protein GYA21_05675 [Myxococcales bacterium]|nr:hypothetical protein [Myxococcales bacterium]